MRKVKNLKTKIAVFLLLFFFCLVTYAANITCILKNALGIECLGCGMTRATVCALRLDFVRAFEYHSMFWSLPLLILYFLFDGHLFSDKKANACILAALAIGFLLNWLFRILA